MSTPKIALVTGGSRGLGKSMALNLAQKGIDVLLTYHSQQAEAEAVVAEIRAVGPQSCCPTARRWQYQHVRRLLRASENGAARYFPGRAFSFSD